MSNVNISEDALSILIEAAEADLENECRQLKKMRSHEEAVVMRTYENHVALRRRAILEAKNSLYKNSIE